MSRASFSVLVIGWGIDAGRTWMVWLGCISLTLDFSAYCARRYQKKIERDIQDYKDFLKYTTNGAKTSGAPGSEQIREIDISPRGSEAVRAERN